MPQFKVGDKVRVIDIDIDIEDDFNGYKIGDVGIIASVIDVDLYLISFDDDGYYAMLEYQLEKVEE